MSAYLYTKEGMTSTVGEQEDFPRGDRKKGLFIPDTAILTNKRSGPTQAQLGEPVSLLLPWEQELHH